MRNIILLAILGCVLLTGCGEVTEMERCENAEGNWKEFPNSCADRCDAGAVCAQVITESCDCGPDMCWDGTDCITR
ncbi:hypothetical protein K9M79_03615 [Candidatus Woesearchaeota archaeon]|nr:hypothetical protein [Candidatus Woesearchaeota archaeon]